MYKCTIDKGVMTFTKGKNTYSPDGKKYTAIREIVKEYNLVQEILHDHGWTFPVVEKLQERSNSLKENLMDLFKDAKKDGRYILNSQKHETPSTKGAGSIAAGNSS